MAEIAILVPSYNNESTIGETLDSVQSLADVDYSCLRVILCDDCSIDTTISTAQKSWWRKENNLEVCTRERNIGQWENTNRSIRRLNTDIDWLFILHSDDMVDPFWYKKLTDAINECPPGVATVCSSWNTLELDGSVTQGENKAGTVEIDGSIDSVRDTLVSGCWWHLSGCAIRLSAYRNIGEFIPELTQLGDWEWLLRALIKGWSVIYIPQSLVTYRQRKYSVSDISFSTDKDVKDRLKVLDKYSHSLNNRIRTRLYFAEITTLVKRRIKRTLTYKNDKRLPSDVNIASILRSWISKSQVSNQ